MTRPVLPIVLASMFGVAGTSYSLATGSVGMAAVCLLILGPVVFWTGRRVMVGGYVDRWAVVFGLLWGVGSAAQGVLTHDHDAIISSPTAGLVANGIAIIVRSTPWRRS